jgi:hypothetical protein
MGSQREFPASMTGIFIIDGATNATQNQCGNNG